MGRVRQTRVGDLPRRDIGGFLVRASGGDGESMPGNLGGTGRAVKVRERH